MTDTPTPGQIAHETYWCTLDGLPPLLAWAQLMPDDRAAWEAAAQAVLTCIGNARAVCNAASPGIAASAPPAVHSIAEEADHA